MVGTGDEASHGMNGDNVDAQPKSKMTMAQRNRKRWRDKKRAKAQEKEEREGKRARPSDEGSEESPTQRGPPLKTHLVALGYSGEGLKGMQMQTNEKGEETHATVEGIFHKALLATELSTTDILADRKKLKFSRAARTDKGVHAALNILALALPVTLDKTLTQEGDGGRNVWTFDEKANVKALNDYLVPLNMQVFGIQRVSNKFDARKQCERRRYEYLLPEFALDGKADAAKLEEVMSQYVGKNKNFFNFTAKIPAEDPSAKRHILSITCRPTEIEGNALIRIQLVGQSFLLHQIRKMIGLAVEVCRGSAPVGAIEECLAAKERRHIHLAPAEGLFLDRVYFDGYNTGKTNGVETVPIEPKIWEEEIEDFKRRVLYPIVSRTVIPKTREWIDENLAVNPFTLVNSPGYVFASKEPKASTTEEESCPT
ncbi:hypothetical protein FOZ60_004538 [Perkinsus olseni]|uniref:Pseudouridine synthase I TruA alpha/beta domain-containing protein n=1 Tax=Perkinsus olseni TaxID=32597 RepID=A0A7J6PGV7_PEROL|nr:hypothetical protein FOZ60_004538 [Perkinsus olseni]